LLSVDSDTITWQRILASQLIPSKSPASHIIAKLNEPISIGHMPLVISEGLFIQIPEQMGSTLI